VWWLKICGRDFILYSVMKKLLLLLFVLFGLIIGVLVYINYAVSRKPINNFEECLAGGGIIMESYPRQCRTADGRLYIEDIREPVIPDDGLLFNNAVLEARKVLSDEFGIEEEEVVVVEVLQREWRNACLELSGEDEMCAQVITPGYSVIFQAGERIFRYRTNESGTSVRFESSNDV
jgi:hypothetical protein